MSDKKHSIYLLRNIPLGLRERAREFAKLRGLNFRSLIFEALRFYMDAKTGGGDNAKE